MGSWDRVVVVEDDPATRALFEVVLGDAGFACDCVASAGEAAARLDGAGAVVAGLADARELAGAPLAIPLLIVSADREAATHAADLGARFLPKPFDIDDLSVAIRQLLAKR